MKRDFSFSISGSLTSENLGEIQERLEKLLGMERAIDNEDYDGKLDRAGVSEAEHRHITVKGLHFPDLMYEVIEYAKKNFLGFQSYHHREIKVD